MNIPSFANEITYGIKNFSILDWGEDVGNPRNNEDVYKWKSNEVMSHGAKFLYHNNSHMIGICNKLLIFREICHYEEKGIQYQVKIAMSKIQMLIKCMHHHQKMAKGIYN